MLINEFVVLKKSIKIFFVDKNVNKIYLKS